MFRFRRMDVGLTVLMAALATGACSDDNFLAPVDAIQEGSTPARQLSVGSLDAPSASIAGWQRPAAASAAEFVTYPNDKVAFILGPQLRSGSRANPWPWFDANAITKGLKHGAAFPADPGIVKMSGKVSLGRGKEQKVTGKGTRFRTEVAKGRTVYIRYPSADGFLVFNVGNVNNDSDLDLSGGWSPEAVQDAEARIGTGAVRSEDYTLAQYYDLGMTMYLAYYRTGNPVFLSHARKVTDSWWKAGNILEGEMRDWGSAHAPRNVSLGGLMLRAMDGRPEMWDWITAYTRRNYKIWLGERLERGKLWYGVRDGGYVLTYTAWLARAHPDAAVRAEFEALALDAAREYYARLQYDDGGWYWKGAAGDSDAPGGDKLFGQPFMIGLLLEGMIAVHQLTGDPVVGESIVKACDWLFTKGYRPDFRGMWYFVFDDGKHRGARDEKQIEEVRQLGSTTVHAFGYAYKISGDAKYLQQGDELFSALFGKGVGPNADRNTGLADAREKEYNQSYRSAGRYLAWRVGAR